MSSIIDPATKQILQQYAKQEAIDNYKQGLEIDKFLQSEADRFRAGQLHQQQILNRGPRDRSFVDEIFADRMPDQWSLAQLKKSGVEAFRPTRSIGIGGHGYGVGDVLLLWPTQPAPGFATKDQLQGLQGSELELQPDGSWLVVEPFYLAGHQYQSGGTLDIWPDTPSRGFIKPMDALQFLKDGDIEPAELTAA